MDFKKFLVQFIHIGISWACWLVLLVRWQNVVLWLPSGLDNGWVLCWELGKEFTKVTWGMLLCSMWHVTCCHATMLATVLCSALWLLSSCHSRVAYWIFDVIFNIQLHHRCFHQFYQPQKNQIGLHFMFRPVLVAIYYHVIGVCKVISINYNLIMANCIRLSYVGCN